MAYFTITRPLRVGPIPRLDNIFLCCVITFVESGLKAVQTGFKAGTSLGTARRR